MRSQAESEPRGGSWGHRLRRAAPWVLGLALATWLLYDRVSLIRAQEALARDAQTRLRAALRGERTGGAVAVVRITDADYATLFGARSPLDPSELQRLLAAVVQGGPRLVGVDIDTSDPVFRGLNVPAAWTNRIVWARPGILLCGCPSHRNCGVAAPVSEPQRFRYCAPGESGTLASMDFLGGRNAGTWGLSSLRTDEDGSIRRFWPAIAMPRDTFPTFAHAIASRAGARPPKDADRARFIRYQPLSSTSVFTASQVMAWARENPDYDALRGRIVLVGGSYWAARDAYTTPLGPMPGVDVHAQILESELRGDAPAEAGGAWVLGALLLSSVGLLWFFHAYTFRAALWRGLLIWIPATATAASLLSTGSLFGLWPYMVPVQLLIVLQQLVEMVNDYRQEWFERTFPRRPKAAEAVEEPRTLQRPTQSL
jgi:CHASE2 domain-containing sensor protein